MENRAGPRAGAGFWGYLGDPQEGRLRNAQPSILKTAICLGRGVRNLSELRVLHILKSLLTHISSRGREGT